jgi:hypothetical protein
MFLMHFLVFSVSKAKLSEYSEKIEAHCTIPGGVLEWDLGVQGP